MVKTSSRNSDSWKVTDAAGLARRIELMGECVGARIEIVVISGFVDANSPQDDRWMIPVATDHAPNVVDGDILPGGVSDVLPARNFFQDEQADFIAGIKKMTRLRVMRGADDVALEFVTQDVGIAALRTAGHRLANEGKGLMPVEAAQLDDFAVELEAVIGELGFAEAETTESSSSTCDPRRKRTRVE